MNYPSAFLVAVNHLLRMEGGFVDDPRDAGGATKYGVSLRYLRNQGRVNADIDHDGDIDKQDVKLLSQDDAISIYYNDWWNKYSYGSFEPKVGKKLLDMSVNMGAVQAHKLLQHALNKLGYNLTTDGVLGPQTRSAALKTDPSQLVEGMKAESIGFYRTLVIKRPEYSKFLNGWVNRAEA